MRDQKVKIKNSKQSLLEIPIWNAIFAVENLLSHLVVCRDTSKLFTKVTKISIAYLVENHLLQQVI